MNLPMLCRISVPFCRKGTYSNERKWHWTFVSEMKFRLFFDLLFDYISFNMTKSRFHLTILNLFIILFTCLTIDFTTVFNQVIISFYVLVKTLSSKKIIGNNTKKNPLFRKLFGYSIHHQLLTFVKFLATHKSSFKCLFLSGAKKNANLFSMWNVGFADNIWD